MIAFIRGIVVDTGKDNVVVETPGGVGYEIHLTLSHLSKYRVGQTVAFPTYLKVSENSQDLYGFENSSEKKFFELLLTVSGIGPKSAMNILALGSIDQIESAIVREDVKYLTAVQGLGKKTAERLVVELKSKLAGTTSLSKEKIGSALSEVVDGLLALGYSQEEAKSAIEGLSLDGKNTEQLLKEALKRI